MFAKFLFFALLGTAMIAANPNKSEEREVLSITITASVTKDLYKRIDEILQAFAQKGRVLLEGLRVRPTVRNSSIEEVLKNILSTLRLSCDQNKRDFGNAVANLHKRRPYKLKTNSSDDQDDLQINIHNLTAQIDADIKANLSINGGIGIKVRSLESEGKWINLKEKVINLLDNAEKTVTEIEEKGSIALTNAANRFEIIKQKGLELVDEAKATSGQVKEAIIQAYQKIENLLKNVNITDKIIEVPNKINQGKDN